MTQIIKALSLWQPWASLIALGHKHFETRSWFTDYRGKLLIHAAKKKSDRTVSHFLQTHYSALTPAEFDWENLPRGKAVCICDFTDCIPITLDFRDQQTELERDCGNWNIGRWAWKLENVEAIEPIPLRGRQGLFNVDVSLFADYLEAAK